MVILDNVNGTFRDWYVSVMREPPLLLKERMMKVAKQIQEGMFCLNIPPQDYSIEFSYHRLALDPTNVRFAFGTIIFNIPMVFLLQAKDWESSSEIYPWLQQYFGTIPNGHQEAILEFLNDPHLSEQATQFVLYHELAHVLHGDILEQGVQNHEVSEKEKRADLTAMKVSKSTQGAIYLLNIQHKYFPSLASSSEKRISYLRDCS